MVKNRSLTLTYQSKVSIPGRLGDQNVLLRPLVVDQHLVQVLKGLDLVGGGPEGGLVRVPGMDADGWAVGGGVLGGGHLTEAETY